MKDEDFKNDAKDAGDMGSGHQVTVLYEIIPVGVPIDLPGVEKSKYTIPSKIDPNAPDEWLTVKMRYKHPEAEVSKELSKALAWQGTRAGVERRLPFRCFRGRVRNDHARFQIQWRHDLRGRAGRGAGMHQERPRQPPQGIPGTGQKGQGNDRAEGKRADRGRRELDSVQDLRLGKLLGDVRSRWSH